MAQGVYVWAKDLAATDPDLSDRTRSTLKKAAVFSADASFDALRFSACAMMVNVVAQRNIWLRNWEVDPRSQNRLVGVPFQGAKLFGQMLDPILMESKYKKKGLPSDYKEIPKSKK